MKTPLEPTVSVLIAAAAILFYTPCDALSQEDETEPRGRTVIVEEKDGTKVLSFEHDDPAINLEIRTRGLRVSMSILEDMGLVDVAQYLSGNEVAELADIELTEIQESRLSRIQRELQTTLSNRSLTELESLSRRVELLKELKEVLLPKQIKSISENAKKTRGKRFYSVILYGGNAQHLGIEDQQFQAIANKCKELNNELRKAQLEVEKIRKRVEEKYFSVFDRQLTREQKKMVESRLPFRMFVEKLTLEEMIRDTQTKEKD